MNIMIVGAGAMGTLLAGFCIRAGHDVRLLVAGAGDAALLRDRGITVASDDGDWHSHNFTASHDARALGPCELTVICTKAYDTAAAVAAALPAVADTSAAVLTLQNGLGNVEAICAAVPQQRVLAGTTSHGATLLGTGHVRHAGKGQTRIGSVTAAGDALADEIVRVFDSAGIATERAGDLQSLLWGKVLINCGINPLCALLDVPNGMVLELPELYEVMEATVREAAAVAGSAGVALPFADPVGAVAGVCRATATNICSMLQDVRAGRRTEIEAINGAVARTAVDCGVAAPLNTTLTRLVSARESLRCGGQ